MKTSEELLAKTKLVIEYGKCADKYDIEDYIKSLDDDQRQELDQALDLFEEMFNHAK